MRWEGNRQSDNVEDRRGEDYSGGGGMGGGFRLGGGLGLGSIVIALLASWFFGINPLTVIGLLGGLDGASPAQIQQPSAPAQKPPANDQMAAFVATILADTEDVWGQVFQQAGSQYPPPKLVLFRGATPTACGTGQTAMGPFYCPQDRKVYIDLAFYNTLRTRLGSPGDFAQAYVIAHEVGHHVQHLMGLTDKVDAARRAQSEAEANAMSVKLELQADCFAGVWANRSNASRQTLEQGDIEEALNAASNIGDDTLQRKSQGVVVPDSFTHGSSAQRVAWFKRGFNSGQMRDCNTFDSRAP